MAKIKSRDLTGKLSSLKFENTMFRDNLLGIEVAMIPLTNFDYRGFTVSQWEDVVKALIKAEETLQRQKEELEKLKEMVTVSWNEHHQHVG